MKQQNGTFQFHESLNADFLNDLFVGDLGYAAEVFNDVVIELPQYWSDMETAFGENNVADLQAAAHKCKTLYAYVGLSIIRDRLQVIETLCNSATDTATLVEEMKELRLQRPEAERIILDEIKRLKNFHEKQA